MPRASCCPIVRASSCCTQAITTWPPASLPTRSCDDKAFVRLVRRRLPQTRIAFISVKPSPARRALADKATRTNRLVRQYSSGDRRLRYVDVYAPMLDASGALRPELYLADSLHMTAAGYVIWRDCLTPVVTATLSGTRAQELARP